MDVVEAPADPSSGERHGELKTLVDQNRNGLDDGEEAQANIFEAFFNASACHPGLVNGAFFWDNWIATDAMWVDFWLGRRSFAVRGKLAEAVVRDSYARLAGTGFRGRKKSLTGCGRLPLLYVQYCTGG